MAVVAARNESERIAATLAGVREALPDVRLWVADDGSRDATASIAEQAGARVVRSERVIGKGGAVTAAARAALAEIAEDCARQRRPTAGEPELTAGEHEPPGSVSAPPVFVLCDGDLGASARELRALAQAVAGGQADVAVAAFARRSGGGFGIALGFARWAIRRRCGLLTRAPISGQRALSAAALTDVLPFASGYGMEMAMTIDAVRAGHRVVEIELELAHRATGRTLAGFLHRARQLLDFMRVYASRRNLGRRTR